MTLQFPSQLGCLLRRFQINSSCPSHPRWCQLNPGWPPGKHLAVQHYSRWFPIEQGDVSAIHWRSPWGLQLFAIFGMGAWIYSEELVSGILPCCQSCCLGRMPFPRLKLPWNSWAKNKRPACCKALAGNPPSGGLICPSTSMWATRQQCPRLGYQAWTCKMPLMDFEPTGRNWVEL